MSRRKPVNRETKVPQMSDPAAAMPAWYDADEHGWYDPELHAWFNPAKHVHSDMGVMERATGHWLDGDGKPASPAIRAQLEAEAAVAAAPETAGETDATQSTEG